MVISTVRYLIEKGKYTALYKFKLPNIHISPKK